MTEYKYKIIQEYRLYKTMDINLDHSLSEYIAMLGQELGERGRFIVKQKGIKGMITVLAEADTGSLCDEVISGFEDYLKENDYLSGPSVTAAQ